MDAPVVWTTSDTVIHWLIGILIVYIVFRWIWRWLGAATNSLTMVVQRNQGYRFYCPRCSCQLGTTVDADGMVTCSRCGAKSKF